MVKVKSSICVDIMNHYVLEVYIILYYHISYDIIRDACYLLKLIIKLGYIKSIIGLGYVKKLILKHLIKCLKVIFRGQSSCLSMCLCFFGIPGIPTSIVGIHMPCRMSIERIIFRTNKLRRARLDLGRLSFQLEYPKSRIYSMFF